MESNDDDLYGDLDITLEKVGPTDESKSLYLKKSSSSNLDDASSVVKLEKENKSLRERIRLLEEENAQLRRNIGTLFRTAKNEIQRKDAQINRLQEHGGA